MSEPVINIQLARDARVILKPLAVAAAMQTEQADEVVYTDHEQRRRYVPRYRIATNPDEHGVARQRLTVNHHAELDFSIWLELYAAPPIAGSLAGVVEADESLQLTTFQLRLFAAGRTRSQFERRFTSVERDGRFLRIRLTITEKDEQTLFNDLMHDPRTEVTLVIDRSQVFSAIRSHSDQLVAQSRLRTKLAMMGQEGMEEWRRAMNEFSAQLKPLHLILSRPLPPLELTIDRADIPSAASRWRGLIRRSVGRHHYYQSAAEPNRFYYLPDYYDFGGTLEFIKVRRGGSTDDFRVDYQAFPRVDVEGRLRPHASQTLASYVLHKDRPIDLLPLLPESGPDTRLEFRLNLPSPTDPNHWSEQFRPTALKDLHTRMSDSIAVNDESLKAIFDSMFSVSEVLFTGGVSVRMADWNDWIEFHGRVDGDKQTVWDAIYNDSVPARAKRTVRVEASSFPEGVTEYKVRFRHGGEASVTPAAAAADAEVRMEIGQYILEIVDEGDYDYQIVTRRGDGSESISEWRRGRDALLII